MSTSREEKELIYLMKKYNFANNIAQTELDLNNYNYPLKKKKSKHEINNQRLLDQVELVYNKIYKEKPIIKSQNKKLLHDMLFNFTENEENSFIEKQKLFRKKTDNNSIKKNFLPKLITSEQRMKNNSKRILLTNNNANININKIKDDEKINERSFSYSNKNIIEENNKRYYLIRGNNKIDNNVKKTKLPPINRFAFKFHKLKLSVNNEIDHTDQKHEDMMKMFKEIEFKNKNRFFV